MRRLRKHADWLLLIVLNFMAFWMLARPLFEQGRIYHDNVRLFSVFRDSLYALNRYGELMLWNPEYTTFGFPAFYFAHLGTNTFTPLSTLVLFSAWLAGLVGIRIDDSTRLYILYVYLAVPLLLSVSFYALARQIIRHPAARAYIIVVAAFSPGVIFNYSDNGPEQTAYGFFAAAAFLRFYRLPSVRTFLMCGLAVGVCTAALNHLALYWNIAFVPLFILVTIFVDRRRGLLRRAWTAVTPVAWAGIALLFASYLAWPAVTFLAGGEIIRSTLGARVYNTQDLLAGNPIESLSSSTPGVGFEWRPRNGSSQPDWAVTTYPGQRFGYTYLGALTLALCLLGLAFGRPPWRTRLVALVAVFCLLLPLAGASGLFAMLVDLVYPLRAVNHFSDTTFRNGTSFLFLLSAGLGLEALVRSRFRFKAAIALVALFTISTASGIVALFTLYPGRLNLPVVSFFLMMSILYIVVVGWLFAPRANIRHVMTAMVVLALVDVSTIAALHMRYVVWPLAEGPFAAGGPYLSLPPDDPRRQYADGLLTLTDRVDLEKAGLDTTRLKELPAYALYEHAAPATPADVDVPLDLFAYLVLSDSSSAGSTPPPWRAPGPWQSARAVHRTYNSFRFETETDRDMYLFWRNSYFPGWSASIRRLEHDGSASGSDWVETPVHQAFWMFMAVRVPAGKTEVVFHFSPRLFTPLFLWTYLSLLVLGLVAVAASVRGVRS